MKNIYWLEKSEKWMVRYRGIYLGTFDDIDDAVEALEKYKDNHPKPKKVQIRSTLTLTKEQYKKFKKLGGYRWLKNFLDN